MKDNIDNILTKEQQDAFKNFAEADKYKDRGKDIYRRHDIFTKHLIERGYL